MYLGYKMNHFLPMIKIVKVNQSYRKLFVLFSSAQILFFTKKSYTPHGSYKLIVMLEKCGRPDLTVFHLI